MHFWGEIASDFYASPSDVMLICIDTLFITLIVSTHVLVSPTILISFKVTIPNNFYSLKSLDIYTGVYNLKGR